jgi:candidate alpha-glucanase; glycoside hydrolase family 87
MKRISITIFMAAMAIAAVGCKDNNIDDKKEDILVETVVLDNSVSEGYTLVEGNTLDISGKVSVTPENAVDLDRIYSSSDEAVATVDAEGVITAIKEGQSTITVEVGSRGRKAEFTLTVAKKVIAVESVVLDEAVRGGIELELGETFELASKVTVLPENATNRTVTYSSSDEAKVTVSNDGVITAVAEGSAIITVTADGKDASFEVTVIVPDTNVYITSLSFSQDETEYELAATTEAIDLMSMLTVEPAGYTEGLVFESSDDAVASVDAEGKLTLKKLTEGVVVTVKAASHTEVTANLTVKAYAFAAKDYPRHVGDGTLEPGDTREYLMTMTCSINPLKAYGGRNNSLHAMLDDKPIINRAGPGNVSDATETNGTAFCFDQMKSTWAESSATSFTIDMKETKTVDYFRVMNISKDRDDCQVRICGFDKIEGSNDGENFEEIARDFGFENCTALGTTNAEGRPEYNLETENIPFPKTLEYRYLRFSFWTQKYFVRRVVGGTQGGSAQIAEFYLGYSKTKVYSE